MSFSSLKLKYCFSFLLGLSCLSILIHNYPASGQTGEVKDPSSKNESEEVRDVDYLQGIFFDLKSKNIPQGSEIVYLDDGNPNSDDDKTILSPDEALHFNPLTNPTDYVLDYREGILRLARPLEINHTLAIYFPGIEGGTAVVGNETTKFKIIRKGDDLKNRYKLSHPNILTDRDFSYVVIDTQSGAGVDRETHPAFYRFQLEKRQGILIFTEPEPFSTPTHNPYGRPPQERYQIRINYRYSLTPLPEDYETFILRPEVRDLPLDASLRFKGEQNVSLASGYSAFVQERPDSNPPVGVAEPFDLRQSLQLEIEGKALSDQLAIDVQYSNKEDQDILLTQPDRITIEYNGAVQPTGYADLKVDITAGNKVATDLSKKTQLDINSKEVLGIKGGLKATDLRVGELTLLHRLEIKGLASRSGGIAATDHWIGGRGVEDEKISDSGFVRATYYDLGKKAIFPGSERVFIDDRNASSDSPNTLTSEDGLYRFDRQFTPRDYTLDYKNGIIKFERGIGLNSVIAIDFDGMPASSNRTTIGDENFNIIKDEGVEGPELKNRYHLRRRSIIPRERDDDFIFEIINSATGEVVINNETLAKLYDFGIDYDEGLLTFTSPLPFDRDTGGIPFGQVTHAYSTPPQERFLIRIRYKYEQEFRLGHINVIEGSERVLIGQGFAIRQLKRDEDYSIFYQIGLIRFRDHVEDGFSDTTRITVNYQYAPFIGTAESTLLGTRLEIEPISGLEVGGSYYRNFADSSRTPPTIGRAPSGLQVLDANVGFDLAKILSPPKRDQNIFRPPLKEGTPPKLSDEVTPQEKSENLNSADNPWMFTLDAEIAASIGEPNTFDVPAAGEFSVSMIDDMEAAKTTANLPIIGKGWLGASAPIGIEGETVGTITAQNLEERRFRGNEEDLIKTLQLSYGPGGRGGRWAGIRRLRDEKDIQLISQILSL